MKIANKIKQILLIGGIGVQAMAAWNGTADTDWYTSNTAAATYTITTAEELAGLAQLVNNNNSFQGRTIVLGADIALNDTTGWKEWSENTAGLREWVAIGANWETPFRGTFDGNDYVVSGIYINKPSDGYQGLFGNVFYGPIKNLGAVALYIKGANDVGGLVGLLFHGVISNSYATGNVEGNDGVGGFVGWNEFGTITGSYATGHVNGGNFLGGLVGYNQSGTISNSYSTGTVNGVDIVGGLVGGNESSTISDSYATGKVEGNHDVGGLVGASLSGTISDSYATGNVEGNNAIGGLMGSNQSGTITNSYATGNVEGNDCVGGLIGMDLYDSAISDSYATGNVEGNNAVGGLMGYNQSGTVSNNYATGNVGGNNNNIGGLVGTNNGIISNSYATGEVKGRYYLIGEGSNLGGLVGHNGYGTISDSYATGNVEGNSRVGGLVGRNSGTISNSHATGNVYGEGNYLGGLVGSNSGTIFNSHAIGNIGGSSYLGGLVGNNESGAAIGNSYATGNVNENLYFDFNYIGGLVGCNGGAITSSYATGNVVGNQRVGGLVGSNDGGAISNSYAIGNVDGGNQPVGGLVGDNSSGIVTNSYYNRQTSGQSDIGRGEGRTTAQMQNKNTYIGWNFEDIWHIDPFFSNGFPYLYWQNELRDAEIEPAIEPQLYTGFPINPKTEKVTLNGKELTEGEDFEYRYGQNIHVATGGIIYIVGKKYFGSKAVEFIIKPARIIDISWFPKCGAIFTYSGEPQNPEPFAMGLDGKAYELEVEGAQTNTGIGLVAMAKLKTAEEDVILQNSSCLYAIEPQELQVNWAGPREFTYNKMNQHPTPSISELPSDLSESDFIFSGYGSVADEYRGSKAPYYIINPADPVKAGNYTLLNNRADYVIHKRPLRPYFSASLPDFETNAAADTLWVPSEIFSEPSLLEETLSKIISYSGFATNTETNESDNAENSLSGTPTVTIEYPLPTPHSPLPILSRRVETAQKATAIISTDAVSSDNYALIRPAIIIMETVEEDASTRRIACSRGDYCTELNEAVCLFLDGVEVESCNDSKSCLVDDKCVLSMLVTECTGIGGVPVETCGATPILSTPYSPTPRIWQSASGVINLDLGYMPIAPVALQIYDLNGKLISSEHVNTRFATVKVNVSNGIYVFKIGSRNIVRVLK